MRTTTTQPIQDPEQLIQEPDSWFFGLFLGFCVLLALVITWLQRRCDHQTCEWCGTTGRFTHYELKTPTRTFKCVCSRCAADLMDAGVLLR